VTNLPAIREANTSHDKKEGISLCRKRVLFSNYWIKALSEQEWEL